MQFNYNEKEDFRRMDIQLDVLLVIDKNMNKIFELAKTRIEL